MIFGSALVGAFVQGVVTELGAATLNRWALAAYILVGFIGTVMVMAIPKISR